METRQRVSSRANENELGLIIVLPRDFLHSSLSNITTEIQIISVLLGLRQTAVYFYWFLKIVHSGKNDGRGSDSHRPNHPRPGE